MKKTSTKNNLSADSRDYTMSSFPSWFKKETPKEAAMKAKRETRKEVRVSTKEWKRVPHEMLFHNILPCPRTFETLSMTAERNTLCHGITSSHTFKNFVLIITVESTWIRQRNTRTWTTGETNYRWTQATSQNRFESVGPSHQVLGQTIGANSAKSQ